MSLRFMSNNYNFSHIHVLTIEIHEIKVGTYFSHVDVTFPMILRSVCLKLTFNDELETVIKNNSCFK